MTDAGEKLDPKGLDAAVDAYCSSPKMNARGRVADVIRAYLAATLPEDVAGVVERLNSGLSNEHTYDPDKDEAASALTAQAAELAAKDVEIAKVMQQGFERCAELAERAEAALAEKDKALEPLARLEIPKKPQGNAGAYSIRHDDIRAARKARGDTNNG